MKNFRIDFTWDGFVTVDAKDEEEAMDVFMNMSYAEIAKVADFYNEDTSIELKGEED